MPAPLANLVRVGVAAAVGALVALLAKWGMHLPAGWSGTIAVAMTAVVAGLYHTVAARLEKQFPWLKILLGNVSAPKPAAK